MNNIYDKINDITIQPNINKDEYTDRHKDRQTLLQRWEDGSNNKIMAKILIQYDFSSNVSHFTGHKPFIGRCHK